ncbi:MAG: small subunit ribosomal protein S9 [Sphingobacteriales bacterium]|jgi:small subunit ribosomal protein S9
MAEETLALGRRKTAVARVRMTEGTGKVLINKREVEDYLPLAVLRYKLNQPFVLTENEGKFDLRITVDGGGITGQVEAMRLGISRALVSLNEDWKPALKAEGLMTRDPRMVERKKPGQKKARKKFQFSKR